MIVLLQLAEILSRAGYVYDGYTVGRIVTAMGDWLDEHQGRSEYVERMILQVGEEVAAGRADTTSTSAWHDNQCWLLGELKRPLKADELDPDELDPAPLPGALAREVDHWYSHIQNRYPELWKLDEGAFDTWIIAPMNHWEEVAFLESDEAHLRRALSSTRL